MGCALFMAIVWAPRTHGAQNINLTVESGTQPAPPALPQGGGHKKSIVEMSERVKVSRTGQGR